MIERQQQDMFSEEDLEKAEALLRAYRKSPIAPAVRFHAALKGLIMDANRSQKKEGSNAILSVDSVEIISRAKYSRFDFSAFAFQDLITVDKKWDAQVKDLDHLISHWLLASPRNPIILLDSHAHEIQDVWSAIENQKRANQENLFRDNAGSGETEFSPDALRRIRNYIIGPQTDGRLIEEFERFRDDFMPRWSMSVVKSLIEQRTTIQRLGEFFRSPSFVYLRGPEFENRSVTRAIPDFDWDGFQDFVTDEAIAVEFEAIRSAITKLASVPKFGKGLDAVTIVAENDALAFADIHTVNSFLRKTGREERVEFVTRSSLLAAIQLALPAGRLDVTVRHPLLLPDVFEFDDGSLSAITEISQRFDAVLTPYLEDYEDGSSDKSLEDEKEDLQNAKEIAHDLVRWLRDTAVAHVSRKREVLNRVQFKSANNGKHNDRDATASVIHEIFDAVIQNIEDPKSPFTTTTLRDLARRNRDMAGVIWERTLADKELDARILKIDSKQLTPAPMMALRILPREFTRLFYLHSRKGQALLERKFLEKVPKGERFDAHGEVHVSLSREDTLYEFDRLIESLTGSFGNSQDQAYFYDITLLICAAFASKGEMTAAASLASTALHRVSVMMRRQNHDLKKLEDVGRLALQELSILRQYCERSTAISNFFKNRRHPTDQFMRGLLEKDFARAQRDLDRAAELDASLEGAEASQLVRSARLRLIHMSGWMDMFLMTDSIDVLQKYDWPERPLIKLGSRRDIWAAVGYTKECLDDLKNLRALAQSRDGNERQRFLAHLEARILQNVIVMFLVLAFSRNVPLMDRVLRADHRVLPDHMLKFVKYSDVFNRFQELIRDYHFNFRIHGLCDLVLSAVREVESMRQLEIDETERRERGAAVWARISHSLADQYCGEASADGFSKLLAGHILNGIELKGLARP